MARNGDIEGDLKLWWHSHVNMDVFWSGTDMDTIKQLGNGGWFLNSVFNLKEEIKTCISMTDPMKLFIDDIPTYIDTEEVDTELVKEVLESMDYDIKDIKSVCANLTPKIDESYTNEWDTEFDDNVTVKAYKYSGNYTWPSYESSYHDKKKKKGKGKVKNPRVDVVMSELWDDLEDNFYGWDADGLDKYIEK